MVSTKALPALALLIGWVGTSVMQYRQPPAEVMAMSIPTNASLFLPVLALLWCGIVLGISFLEAPAKFKSKHASREALIDVGRTVFAALHRVEVVLSLLALATASVVTSTSLWDLLSMWRFNQLRFACAIVAVQHATLIPALQRHADAVVLKKKESLANTAEEEFARKAHLFYIAVEIAKVAALLWFASAELRSLANIP